MNINFSQIIDNVVSSQWSKRLFETFLLQNYVKYTSKEISANRTIQSVFFLNRGLVMNGFISIPWKYLSLKCWSTWLLLAVLLLISRTFFLNLIFLNMSVK